MWKRRTNIAAATAVVVGLALFTWSGNYTWVSQKTKTCEKIANVQCSPA
jgi:hypothetical protein